MNERKKHFAVDNLSSYGRGLVDGWLSENLTYDKIVAALKEKTGEKLAVSSLQRYHANKWFPLRKTLEENDRVFGLVKETLEKSQGKKFDEVTSELAKAQLFRLVAALKDPDPLALYQVVISEGRLAVEKEKVGISKDKLKLEQKRVEALEKQVALKEEALKRAKEKTESAAGKIEAMAKKKGLDPQTLKKIREEVYGIVDATAGS